MIGMMHDLRFLTGNRHSELLVEAQTRRLTQASNGRDETDGLERTGLVAGLRDRTHRLLHSRTTTASSGATSASGVAPAPSPIPTGVTGASVVAMERTRSASRDRGASLPCDGSSPEVCAEGRAAA